MPWDLLDGRRPQHRLLWLVLALWLCVLRMPALVETLKGQGPWGFTSGYGESDAGPGAWAEGYPSCLGAGSPGLSGLPAFPQHRVSALDDALLAARSEGILIDGIAASPLAARLVQPLLPLGPEGALLAWNLLSLAALAVSLRIIVRTLGVPGSVWTLALAIALVLASDPLRIHLEAGQFTLIVLALLTGAWAAERSERPLLAGAFLGTAILLEWSCGIVLLSYAARGRWRVVGSALLALAALFGLTMGPSGLDAAWHGIQSLGTQAILTRGDWNNLSLLGFWTRLLDPVAAAFPAYGLGHQTALTWAATGISAAVLLGAMLRAAWQARSRPGPDGDRAFSLAVMAMLLISPLTREYDLLLLLTPLAVVWAGLPATRPARAAFFAIVAALWLGPERVWNQLEVVGRATSPIDALGLLAYPCYAVLGLLALTVGEMKGAAMTLGNPRRRLAIGAAVMGATWVHIVQAYWLRHGLFSGLGLDFAINRAVGMARILDGPAAMYDMGAIAAHIRPLLGYYGDPTMGPVVGPGPYPAFFYLPLMLMCLIPPVTGFLIWTAINLALAILVSYRLVSRFANPSRGLVASTVLFFPIPYALFFGQMPIIILYGLERAYRSYEAGDDFRAGLWSGMLLLKPQYVVVLTLVLLWKRRWRAFCGLALAGLVVLGGSVAITGIEGTRVYLASLHAMSALHAPHTILFPRGMINWRGIVVNTFPSISDPPGLFLTGMLSLATIATLPVIWHGRWEPDSKRFASQFLATMIATMLVSYHNHIHGGCLLLVPLMAMLARGTSAPPWPKLVMVGLYAPTLLYFLTGYPIPVAWLLVGLMLAGLGSIFATECRSLLVDRERATLDRTALVGQTAC